jgi:poly(3-hydroxybutyrate) depolymerase
LIDGLSERLCIDKDRIYATGLGSGGGLVHLLACDPNFSDQFAAFAGTNPVIFAGVIDRRAVKDEITMMWEKCKPARIPIRFLEIHSENNTVSNYWGKSPVGESKHRRMPTVQWLVEWAMRNECGQAMSQPAKENEDDKFYLTDLEGGTIQEGIAVADKLQKAFYKCYQQTEDEKIANFLKSFQIEDVDSILAKEQGETSEETKSKASDAAKIKDSKEEVVKELSEKDKPKKDRGVVCLVHFFLKNYGHGWPRVLMKEGMTEPIGPNDVATDEAPIFDATVEVLDWFSKNKLSDEFHAPNLEGSEDNANVGDQAIETLVEKLGSGIKEKIQGVVGEEVGGEGSGEKAEMKDTDGEKETKAAEESTTKVETKEAEGSKKEKDEL